MPKIHTPISDEEAEEWVRRMIRDAEDLYEMGDPYDWAGFVSSKLYNERGQDINPFQDDVLRRGRALLQQEMAQAGLSPVTFLVKGREVRQIRDLTTGQFVSWSKAQKIIVPFR